MNYTGEHLWPGFIGHLSVILAFVAALLSALSYAFYTKSNVKSWHVLGRSSFILHGLSAFTVIGILFYVMIQRYYEYEYVWGHTSDSLPFQYIFSAFWEGQEGSFLLWIFWNIILGLIVMRSSKQWEGPVMFSYALVQALLCSMLLGFYIGENDARIGSNPFALLRNVHEAPIFSMPDYLSQIKGTGLNPLLQNYWMTIHPPTLFLGFASTLTPFAFAIAGLWKKNHTDWIKPALNWALFSAGILGIGILMGGAWAYEALSFGGYWAWDPVENASLVPWLFMVAGIHTALVSKNTGYSIKSTYQFFLWSFILIVYSTFLTRSGILGETSVHAFTEMGMEWQLVFFLLVLILWPMTLYFLRMKGIPQKTKEETVYSREFWMFVGALVLLFSSLLISFTTSIPVWNKIADGISGILGMGDVKDIAPPEDEVEHHNKFQIWIAILMAFLSAFSIFLRYKATEISSSYKSFLLKYLGFGFLASLLFTTLVLYFSELGIWPYALLMFCSIFTLITNLSYIIAVLKGKIKVAAGPIAHIGFGILMIGVLFSGLLKRPISTGFNSIEVNDINPQSNKNVLVAFGDKIPIGEGYSVQYTRDWPSGNMQFFELIFTKRDKEGRLVDSFTTTPNVIRDSLPEGKFKFRAANPNTKHYFGRDIFTMAVPHWAFDEPDKKKEVSWTPYKMAQGDTIFTKKYYVIFKRIDNEIPQNIGYVYEEGDIPVTAILEIRKPDTDTFWIAKPFFYIRNSQVNNIAFELPELNMSIRLPQILAEEKKMLFEIKDEASEGKYVVVQALVFPGILWVWVGSILMMLGLIMGWIEKRNTKDPS